MHGHMNFKFTAISHKRQDIPGESAAVTVAIGSQESTRVCADTAEGW